MLQEVVDCNKDMTTGYSAVTKGTSESVSHFDWEDLREVILWKWINKHIFLSGTRHGNLLFEHQTYLLHKTSDAIGPLAKEFTCFLVRFLASAYSYPEKTKLSTSFENYEQ